MATLPPGHPGEDATDMQIKTYYQDCKLQSLNELFEDNGKDASGWKCKVYLYSKNRRPCNTYFISPTGVKYGSMKAVKEAFGWLTPVASDDESADSDADSAAVPTPEQQSLATSAAEEASEHYDSEQEEGEAEEGSAVAGSQEAAPVVLLPEVEIVTGEEGEQTLFEEHAKLFRFDLASKQWCLRGKGWATIKRMREPGSYRFLFREDETMALRANHRIVPGIVMNVAPDSVRWCCLDYAGGKEENTQFAIKFDCQELALRFRDMYQTAIDSTKFGEVDASAVLDTDLTVSEHRLHVLTLDELQRLCYALGIKPRSDKLAAIKDLVEAKIQYHELGNMSQLKRMLEAEGQQVSGRRSELEQRLIATHPGQAGLAAAGAPSSYEAYGARAVQQQKRNSLVARDELEAAVGRSLNNELSQEAFRKIMNRHGLLEGDMEVCHIIARANGGANHHDNYYLLGGKFNHKLSRYGDHIMCYVVGQEKAARAVEISQRLGNGTYGKYKGKSAEMLYEEGSRAISRALQDSALERKPRLYR